jgi:hypothetical protein
MRAGLVLPTRAPAPVPVDLLAGVGPAWTRVDHVPFGATVDVEHVLLSEAGVVVVTLMHETEELAHALTEARWRARKVMALLGPVQWISATPVLVACGLADLEVSGGNEVRDGVLVVRAVAPCTWVDELEQAPAVVTPERIGEMVDVLVAHTLRTDAVVAAYTAARRATPRLTVVTPLAKR